MENGKEIELPISIKIVNPEDASILTRIKEAAYGISMSAEQRKSNETLTRNELQNEASQTSLYEEGIPRSFIAYVGQQPGGYILMQPSGTDLTDMHIMQFVTEPRQRSLRLINSMMSKLCDMGKNKYSFSGVGIDDTTVKGLQNHRVQQFLEQRGYSVVLGKKYDRTNMQEVQIKPTSAL